MSDFLAHGQGYLALLGAFALTFPIGWNREQHSDIMGVRSFPLVALGACAYILIARAFIGDDAPDATARIVQGLMTGIGFLGGGAILKHDDHVTGTASAASIWVVGALGAAAAFGYWDYAILLALVNFGVVALFGRLKTKTRGD